MVDPNNQPTLGGALRHDPASCEVCAVIQDNPTLTNTQLGYLAETSERICSSPTCDNPVHSSGLCMSCYQWRERRVKRNLTPEYLDGRLRKHGWVVTDFGCWEWAGYRNPLGYGELKVFYRSERAPRLAYEAWVGPIGEGLVVRHKCDNPPCINPEHLETGTNKDNTRDMITRGRDRIVGSKNSRAKFTDQEVLDIRMEYATGLTDQYRLARLFNVSQTTIGQIVRKETYFNV